MNWKILVTLAVIAVLSGMFLFSNNVDVKSFLPRNVGSFADIFEKPLASGNVPIVLQIRLSDAYPTEFKMSDAEVRGTFSLGQIMINDEKFGVRNPKSELYFKNFNGKVEIGEDGLASIDGATLYLEVDSIYRENETLEVKLKGIPIEMWISEAYENLETSSAHGSLEIGDTAEFKLNGDALKVDGFDGEISIKDGMLTLRGTCARVEITNQNKYVIS